MPTPVSHPANDLSSLGLVTANDIYRRVVASDREQVILTQDEGGFWRPISARDVEARVRRLGGALLGFGVGKGDRVAILAENRWEWAVTDFAVLAIGAVDVPIYPTLTAEQTAALLIDSDSRVAVVSTAEQYAKVAGIRERTVLEHIILMEEPADSRVAEATQFASLMPSPSESVAIDPEFEARLASVTPEDLATIIYTSGTTGEPKGVMLSHGNIAANVNYSTVGIGFRSEDVSISFLPLSHITARHLDYALFTQGVSVAYCAAFDKLPAAMTAVKPSIFVAVPRVYEKIRQEVERRAGLSPIKKRLLRWAIATGARHRDEILSDRLPRSAAWRLAAKLVLTKIHGAFGGQARLFISGGAPLGLDTATWFADAGIRILEGYGLTETSPVVALNKPGAYRLGSVGKPLRNVECRLAADGELLLRGPSVFRGYWGNAKATAEVFDEAGWFSTGDVTRFDEDGFLYITDRKKELIKTSGGKFIAPAPIESKLKSNLLVAEAALVGDRRKFASVLIAPNFGALEAWARERDLPFSDRRSLVADPAVIAEYQAIVDRVNAGLANFETLKRFRLVPEEWSVDGGELTLSLKLKRRVVAARYAAEIEQFYRETPADRS